MKTKLKLRLQRLIANNQGLAQEDAFFLHADEFCDLLSEPEGIESYCINQRYNVGYYARRSTPFASFFHELRFNGHDYLTISKTGISECPFNDNS